MFELAATAATALVCALPMVGLDMLTGTAPWSHNRKGSTMLHISSEHGSTSDYVDALLDVSDYEVDSYGAEFIATELISADDMVSELLADWDAIADDYDALDTIDAEEQAYLDAVYSEHVDTADTYWDDYADRF